MSWQDGGKLAAAAAVLVLDMRMGMAMVIWGRGIAN